MNDDCEMFEGCFGHVLGMFGDAFRDVFRDVFIFISNTNSIRLTFVFKQTGLRREEKQAWDCSLRLCGHTRVARRHELFDASTKPSQRSLICRPCRRHTEHDEHGEHAEHVKPSKKQQSNERSMKQMVVYHLFQNLKKLKMFESILGFYPHFKAPTIFLTSNSSPA